MRCTHTDRIDWAAYHADPGDEAWAEVRAHYPTCPDCSREVARFAEIRARLATSQPSAHPREEELLAFDRSPANLTAARQAEIGRHVEDCRRCRNELAVLEAMMPVGAFSSQPTRPVVAEPSLVERLRSFFSSTPALAALGAAAVLMIGLLVTRQDGDIDGRDTTPIAQEGSGGLERERSEAPIEDPNPLPPTGRLAERPPAPAQRPGGDIETPGRVPPTPEPVERLAERPADDPTPSALPRAEPIPPTRAPAGERLPDRGGEILLAALDLPHVAPSYDPSALLGASGLMPSRADVIVRGGEGGARVRALGPIHTAITFEASPRLHWHLSSESDAPVELLVIDEATDEAVFEATLPAPVAQGLRTLDLAEEGVVLTSDRPYLFFVSIVRDPERRDLDRMSRLTLVSRPDARPEPGSPEQRVERLARAGSWIDAFATLQRWIEARPDLPRATAHRASLLEQVDREEVARALEAE